jgi:ABC-type transporter Mla subunit MlaD
MSIAAPANYWKLGLFVVSGVVLGLAVLAWLGAGAFRKDTFEVVTYFDESVQGLEIGAPVRIRGIKAGSVSKMQLAPDRRHIEVTCEMDRNQIKRLGVKIPKEEYKSPPPYLRTQLSQVGIAGTLFVLVDAIDPERFPPPKLPFEAPPNYVPSMRSTFKDISEELRDSLHHLPDLATRLDAVLAKAERGIEDAQIAAVSSHVQDLLVTAEAVLKPLPPLSTHLAEEGNGLAATVASIGSTARVAGDEIAAAKVPETLTAIREMAIAIRKTATDLDRLTDSTDQDLQALHETLRSLKTLADTLENDPGVLLRGKAGPSNPPEGGGP